MKTKYIIVVATLFLVAATQTIKAKAQGDNTQNTTNNEIVEKPAVPSNNNSERAPFTTENHPFSQPNYTAPPGAGDAQKLGGEVSVSGGIGILLPLVIAYGFIRRKKSGSRYVNSTLTD